VLDKFFAIVSMAGVVAFMGVVIIGVKEPDLWIVTILILGIAILFFWEEIKAGGSHFEEKLPTILPGIGSTENLSSGDDTDPAKNPDE